MPRTVVDVHSITAAQGWRFKESGEPVAVFVLVSYTDSEYPSLGLNKCVVALSEMDYGDDLTGFQIDGQTAPAIEKDEP